MIQTLHLAPSVTLRCCRDSRFKQGCLSFQLVRPMDAGTASMNALIPSVLLRGTNRCPDLRAITQQLESAVVPSGETATVSFTATGDDLVYQWYYKDVGVKKFALTTSFTGNEYSAVINSYRDGRQVYCVITDKFGNSVQSNVAVLGKK